MEKDDASQITNTTDPDKKNFESQDDWREYAYGGKSLLDDSDDNTDTNQSNENTQTGESSDPDQPQDDWREYAYGGKSLLDDSDDNTKPVSLEQKRNLVIGHIPPVDDTDTKKGDSEPTQQKD